MASDDLPGSLVGLLEKEPPLPPEWVEARTEAGPVQAILFAADAGWPLYCPEPEQVELADILASSVGHIGTMAEYLLNIVTELELAGIHDPHLWALQALVAERLERLPAALSGLDRRVAARFYPAAKASIFFASLTSSSVRPSASWVLSVTSTVL